MSDETPGTHAEHSIVGPPPDDGTLLEVRADPTPLLVALGALLLSLGAVVVSIIALVD